MKNLYALMIGLSALAALWALPAAAKPTKEKTLIVFYS